MSYRCFARFAAWVCFLGAVGFQQAGLAQSGTEKVYCIQLGAFPQEAAAAELRDKLDVTSTSVYIRRDDKTPSAPYKVCLGKFGSYMDAWAAESALPASYPSGFIASFASLSSEVSMQSMTRTASAGSESAASLSQGVYLFQNLPPDVPEVVSANPSDFVSISVPEAGLQLQSDVQGRSLQSTNRSELLDRGMNGKNNDEATSALQNFLQQYPSDPAEKAARLRLSRRLLGKREFSEAKEQLSAIEITGTPEEKGKARLVKAYVIASEKGRKAGFDAFKQIADDGTYSPLLRSHAMRLAAGHAHAAREYTTAVLAFNQIIAESPVLEDRLEAKLQRCAIMFELVGRGKGTWEEVIKECGDLKADSQATDYVRMGAGLMEFEAHKFKQNFEQSYQLGKAFLEQWGEDPTAYGSQKMRQYINTARLFQMQNAYVTGRDSEALSIAAKVVATPPAEREQFATANTFLYACVIGALSSASDDSVQATDYENKGREFNAAYYSMLSQTLKELKAKHQQN